LTPDFAALRAIGWPHVTRPTEGEWAALMAAHPSARPARVVEQHRSGYVVAESADGSYGVESLPDWQRPRLPSEQRPAVGDWLLVTGDAGGNAQAVALLPRRTTIKRSAAGKHYGQQIIAANIDIVFIVCSLDGDFNPRRIERYLLLVRGGAHPVVVITKTDIGDAGAAMADLEACGIEVFAVDARDSTSVAGLNRWLGPGTTAVLVGSSGVGKSTLTNTLLGERRMKTGAVRETDARGRHTTTHRALIALPSGACLIDTPGMRELKPTGEEDLAEDGFADIEALAAHCRFRDCRHASEPGCAVRAAIEAGDLDAGRFGNYRKLSEEIAGAADQLAVQTARRSGERKPRKTPGKASAKPRRR
jgi:ribosome biogenesis GTPase